MSRSFDLGNKIRRQKNGIATPPNEMARIAPPNWKNEQLFLTPGTFTFTVPQNVYQIIAMVWGGGGTGYNNGTASNRGGGGAGFAMGIIDVVPGQVLQIITVGGISGTSSIGALLSATGGTTATTSVTGVGGIGVVNPSLRFSMTSAGGNGGVGYSAAGGSAGSTTGNGETGGYLGGMGLPMKPIKTNPKYVTTATYEFGNNSDAKSSFDADSLVDVILNPFKFFEKAGGDLTISSTSSLQLLTAGSGGIFGAGGDIIIDTTGAISITKVVTGDGGFGAPSGSYLLNSGSGVPASTIAGRGGFGAPSGISNSNNTITVGNSGLAAGGSASLNGGKSGGTGAVILAWTEGY